MTIDGEASVRGRLLARGRRFEVATLAWNVAGIVVLAVAAVQARSVALAVYLIVQSTVVLVVGYHPRRSVVGVVWTAVTAAVMLSLAVGKARTGAALDNPVLRTEGRVTMIDGILATAVLAGLVLNASLGWWWADPGAGYVLVYYGAREAHAALSD